MLDFIAILICAIISIKWINNNRMDAAVDAAFEDYSQIGVLMLGGMIRFMLMAFTYIMAKHLVLVLTRG